MIGGRRKKWTEAEEKTLIEKYGEMMSDGSLPKMKTREKKFGPIAIHVNSVHHIPDPLTYPWRWSWKDVSTKLQNMRHQYLLVKQKIKSDQFHWEDALSHWSNFLLYKDVFGDLPIPTTPTTPTPTPTLPSTPPSSHTDLASFLNHQEDGMEMMQLCQLGNAAHSHSHSHDGDFPGIDAAHDLGFHYHEAHQNCNSAAHPQPTPTPTPTTTLSSLPLPKKRKTSKLCFISNHLAQLKDMEARFEQNQIERERDRQRRETALLASQLEWDHKLSDWEKARKEREGAAQDLRKRRLLEWETLQKKMEEESDRIREERYSQERELEDRMSRKKTEWGKRIDGMLNHHRAEMTQMQARLLHDQQSLTNQLLGMISHWATHSTTLSDHASTNNHYLSQIMQNLHHVNGVHEDTRLDGDTQEDQFIVDG